MWFSVNVPALRPVFAFPAFICGLLLLLLLCADETPAQRKPLLLPARRDYLAGKFVLLPSGVNTTADQLPRLVAQIADHEIIAPPWSMLGSGAGTVDYEGLTNWVKKVDYAETDGVIVSLDLLAAQSDETVAQRRLEPIRWIRAQHPYLAIYGFAGTSITNEIGVEMTAAGTLDELIISADDLSDAAREKFQAEPNRRKLNDRVQIVSAKADAALLLLLRHLNHRFGLAPKILPIFSNAPLPALDSLITASGGMSLSSSVAGDRRGDILLFVRQPQTDEQKFNAFMNEFARAIAAGYRVALADLASGRTERERLLDVLRRGRTLDQLYGYAASDDSSDGLAPALAQASARLIAARFLRDDTERLRRIEQAQIELLFNRWLKASVFDLTLRSQLDAFLREQLKADPENMKEATERAEAFALGEFRRLASETFSEQFRHNVHSVLLSSGERAEFRVRAIQHSRLSFPLGRLSDPEIRLRVYLLHEGNVQAENSLAAWELRDIENLDARLSRFYEAVNWPGFDVGAGVVQLSFSITGTEGENYSIRSQMKKGVRRIEINAPSARGAFYALAKLEQLGVDGRLREDFQITEAPFFKERGVIENFSGAAWSPRDRLDVMRWLGRARMNRYYYAPHNDPLCHERWRENYTGNELSRFKDLLRVADENFVELVYVISPGATLNDSDDADFNALTRRLAALTDLGVRHFALFCDHAIPAELISRASAYLKSAAPNSTLAVSFPEQKGDELKRLVAAIPKEVLLLASPDASQAAINDRLLIIRDDFLSNYKSPRLFLGAWRAQSAPQNQQAIGFVIAPLAQAHATMLPLVAAAEYAWNPREYDPETALTRALNLLYDARSRAAMRVWSNAFREQSVFASLLQPQPDEINVPLIERRLGELRPALEAIGATRERGLARGELARVITRIEKSLERLKNDPAWESLPDGRLRKRAAGSI
jgi:hypothetical protein